MAWTENRYRTRCTAPFGICPHCCAGEVGKEGDHAAVIYSTVPPNEEVDGAPLMLVGDCNRCLGEWKEIRAIV